MARIPEELLGRIKEEVSMVRLAEARGVALRKHGADLIGRCPWHDDHEPSMVITTAKNLWHCLGACRAGGTPIDWTMRAEGVSFRHAVEILRAEYFPGSLSLGVPARSSVPKLACPVDLDAEEAELARQVVGYYHETLKQSPEALAYLEKRGIASAEAIECFKLGFANRTLGYRLPAMNRKSGEAVRTKLANLGFIRDSGHEHFNGSIVVPVFGEQGGEQGEVLGAYGRKIGERLTAGTPLHLYLPGPHRGVWNLEAFQASKEIILCEALFDALTFWCAGFRNVTTSYGVEGFTPDHLAAMKTYGTEHVLIAYDRDDAGDRAASELAERLAGESIACSRIQFPHRMDANEYALKVQPAAKALGLLVRSAEWLGSGKRAPRAVTQAPQTPAPAVLVSSPPRAENASAAAPPLAAKKEKQATPGELVLSFGDRRYRVRGHEKNLSFGTLRLNLLASREGEEAAALFAAPSPLCGFHVDTLDLYAARQRASFEKEAAHELGVAEEIVKRDLGALLRQLEDFQQEAIRSALEPKQCTVTLSESETAAAFELWRDPKLIGRILADFERVGVVGEETNKLVGYLAAVSRKLDRPLAVIIQSSSAAGKSWLMEAILAFVPEEERESYSALTGMSLFYFSEGKSLKHKVLAIAEEEGAERATYALKLLQSEGRLSIASTGKDPATGRLVTQEYRVEGPVMIFLTTTRVTIDEELLNRCLVLTVDEEREQTRAIHRLQRERETLEGLLAERQRQQIVTLHQNAQRLLRPLAVVNPFARELTFLDDRTRTRRDHMKYLALIRSVTLLHQYQRQVRSVTMPGGESLEYIEVTREDIAIANRLAAEVLGRSLDELPPQTRKLLGHIEEMAGEETSRQSITRAEYRFTLRDVRTRTSWSHDQLWRHMGRLVALEYVLLHRGGRGQSFLYELLYDGSGKDGRPFLAGLFGVEQIQSIGTMHHSAGETASTAGGFGPLLGGACGGSAAPVFLSGVPQDGALRDSEPEVSETALLGSLAKTASYVHTGGVPAGGNGSRPRQYLVKR